MITSPTYEGIVSDIAGIAEAVHEKNIPLIVDEAHGAHFNWIPTFPETAVRQGADLVIESLHKTLPAFTQTAVLHQTGNRIDEERLLWALQTYQSSSPSYLLMASIAKCFEYVKTEESFSAEHFVKKISMIFIRKRTVYKNWKPSVVRRWICRKLLSAPLVQNLPGSSWKNFSWSVTEFN